MDPFNITSAQDLFLAIDQGGHSTRALIYNGHGDFKAGGKRPVTSTTPQEDWVEQDPEEMLQSIQGSVMEALEAIGDKAPNIMAAGLATQRSSLVCWDKETGKALSPIISWRDRRASRWLDSLPMDREWVHRATGLFVTAHYGASKFRWCLDNLPAVVKALEKGRLAMGPMASFLVFRLLEERPYVADPANASRTQLWNVKTRDWDPELMELFDLPLAVFPRCVPTQYHYGTLNTSIVPIPLTILNGDQSAAMFAFGDIQPETAYINIGTGAFISRPSGHYPGFARRLLTSVILQDKDESTYVTEGTVNGAASALDWLQETHSIDTSPDNLDKWLAKVCNPPLFLNGIAGLGAPFWIAEFHSEFIGEGDDGEKAVAVIESIVFLLRINMEEMQKQASPPLQIQITGGLASLDGLCQRLADVSSLPVYRPVEREATARGTAYLVANCPSKWPESDIGVWFKPKENDALQQRYQVWKDAMLEFMRKD